MWFWFGKSRGAGSKQAHDTRGRDAILSCTGNSHGCTSLYSSSGCLERWLYLWGAFTSSNSLSSTKSCTAGKCLININNYKYIIMSEWIENRTVYWWCNEFQLELITELLGTPTLEDMRYACEGARTHMLRRAPKPSSLTALYTLSSQATHEAVHLLCQMLVFDPVRIPPI